MCSSSGLADKKGKCRLFFGLDDEFSSLAVVSLGKKDAGFNKAEEIDEGKENIRIGVAGILRLNEKLL